MPPAPATHPPRAMLPAMQRSIAGCLLCALLAWGAVPFAAATGRPDAGCAMTCCKRGAAPATAMHAMKGMGAGASRVAAPAGAPLSCSCGAGRSQQSGIAGGQPSVLPIPPRLPAPCGASRLARRAGPPLEPPSLDLPERPPRA